MLIGKYLATKREENKWSQATIAKKLDIPRSTYAAYEQSRNGVDMPMVYKISTLLNVSREEIVKNAEDVHPLETQLKEDNTTNGNSGNITHTVSLRDKYIALLERENERMKLEAMSYKQLEERVLKEMHAWTQRLVAYETRMDALREFLTVNLASLYKSSTQEAVSVLGIIENRLIQERSVMQSIPSGDDSPGR